MKKRIIITLSVITFAIQGQNKNVDIQPYFASKDVVSVVDFGAKADGKTDDTQAQRC
jgi:polygalacturonase